MKQSIYPFNWVSVTPPISEMSSNLTGNPNFDYYKLKLFYQYNNFVKKNLITNNLSFVNC